MKPYYQTELGALYHGNCLDVMKELRRDRFRATFSFYSPPYNRKRDDKYNKYSDTIHDYYSFIVDVSEMTMRLSEYTFLNIQKNMYNKADVFKLFGHYANYIIEVICWGKSNPMPASNKSITNAYEFIFMMSYDTDKIKATKEYTKNLILTDVYSENPYKSKHRAVMNPEIVIEFLSSYTKENDMIFDPFFGMGTTGLYCEKLNRRWVGIEVSEEYCEMAAARIEREREQGKLF